MGAITDENARTTTISLSFLEPGKIYQAIIYADDETADWKNNPMAYKISKQTVTSNSSITLKLAPCGGCAVSLKKL